MRNIFRGWLYELMVFYAETMVIAGESDRALAALQAIWDVRRDEYRIIALAQATIAGSRCYEQYVREAVAYTQNIEFFIAERDWDQAVLTFVAATNRIAIIAAYRPDGDTTGLRRPAGWGGMRNSGWIFFGETIRAGWHREQAARYQDFYQERMTTWSLN